MQNISWNLERVATGKYHVRLSTGLKIPGEISGGFGRWVVLCRGAQWDRVFKTRNEAAERIVRKEFGLLCRGE